MLLRHLDHELFLLWRRQVFCRNRHMDFTTLLNQHGSKVGIYLIGCADQIVYVGQTYYLNHRPIESIGNIYHRVHDTSLPWSIAFAPCSADEMNERESTAIRTYAPKFNFSIPSIAKSLGRMPDIASIAPVFIDQDEPGGAFRTSKLQAQKQTAIDQQHPPWKVGKRTATLENDP